MFFFFCFFFKTPNIFFRFVCFLVFHVWLFRTKLLPGSRTLYTIFSHLVCFSPREKCFTLLRSSEPPAMFFMRCILKLLQHLCGFTDTLSFLLGRVKYKKRELKPACGSECRLKCEDRISEDTRQQLFEKFYALDYQGQTAFFLDSRHKTKKKRRRPRKSTNNSRRNKRRPNYQWIVAGERVCKKWIMTTFQVGTSRLRNLRAKKSKRGTSLFSPVCFCLCDPSGRNSVLTSGGEQCQCWQGVRKTSYCFHTAVSFCHSVSFVRHDTAGSF